MWGHISQCSSFDAFIRLSSACKPLSNHMKTTLIGHQISWQWHTILVHTTHIISVSEQYCPYKGIPASTFFSMFIYDFVAREKRFSTIWKLLRSLIGFGEKNSSLSSPTGCNVYGKYWLYQVGPCPVQTSPVELIPPEITFGQLVWEFGIEEIEFLCGPISSLNDPCRSKTYRTS